MKPYVACLAALSLLCCSCSEEAVTQLGPGFPEVTIKFAVDASGLPDAWDKLGIPLKVEPVSPAARAGAEQFVVTCLRKYPAGFVAAHVSTAYLYAGLKIDGLEFKGTYEFPTSIHIDVDNRFPEWIERSVHEEISSLLYHKYYRSVEEVGLEYRKDHPPPVVGQNNSVLRDETYVRKGFLSPYAATCPEEDFNAIAAALMTGDAVAWKDAAEHDMLGRKFDKVIQFYGYVDERFTKEFFKGLVDTPN